MSEYLQSPSKLLITPCLPWFELRDGGATTDAAAALLASALPAHATALYVLHDAANTPADDVLLTTPIEEINYPSIHNRTRMMLGRTSTCSEMEIPRNGHTLC
ncbi:hypothetical protein N7541_008885 [Penicillium brevicompactum]|uniref:Uncharacterized protein n=1 Tax=Penicillium brevicompactum TaxID=5074 RepID=A0A9W9ULP1_PENBR|nr:hypothetical protein N7541_008885 [Penicillium brevicompactum]